MALATVRKILRNQNVVVAGSAPLSDEAKAFLASTGSHRLVCANGAISSFRKPDVWVLNSRQYDDHVYNDPLRWNDHRKQLHESMMSQAANAKARHIVFLLKSYTVDQTVVRLKAANASWRGQTLLNTGQKTDLAVKAGVQRFSIAFNTSAGLFAACLALICRPKTVTLVGFSFKEGHSYLPDATNHRFHIEQDQEALTQLLPKHPNFNIIY